MTDCHSALATGAPSVGAARRRHFLLTIAGALTVTLSQGTLAQAPHPPADQRVDRTLEHRIDSLVATLSLEDKIKLIGGTGWMYTFGQSSIGLPKIRMSDGPFGPRTWGPSTGFAAGVMLAAAWDPALAHRVGTALGVESKARGVSILLGPGVNIAREPQNGRNFEYFSEDPFLNARLAVSYITGVQSQGVIATIKHFAANNYETQRHFASSDVDERTLRELYFPAFEAAIRKAHVGAVMSSYNRVNGTYTSQHQHMILDVLKGEWGFDGLYMSDWRATHDGVEAAKNGLDLEMPSPLYMNAETLVPAVKSGAIPMAAIDDKIRRLLRVAYRFGIMDRQAPGKTVVAEGAAERAVALDAAREGIVLLKNNQHVLPLAPNTIKTIAVIGPDAWPAVPGGGGSSRVTPFRAKSFLEGIRDAAGDKVRVLYAPGLPAADELMHATAFDREPSGTAITVEQFQSPNWTGPSTMYKTRFADDWVRDLESGPAAQSVSSRWTAKFTPPVTGKYLVLGAAGDGDEYTLSVDGKAVVTQASDVGPFPRWKIVSLTAGQTVPVKMDYVQNSARPNMGFGIVPLDSLVTEEAKRIAAEADVAVVCVGFDNKLEGEGYDRTWELPWGQDELINAVAAANHHTIVTVTAGGGVDMQPWIDNVPAVLHTWYAGQEGGTALGEILFGARSPEGKLPITLDRAWTDNPVHAHDTPVWDSVAGFPRVQYAESLMVGYRYYTTAQRKPLFPFGFGLSYTTFAMSNVHAPKQGSAKKGVDVTVDVVNTGKRTGAEVVQLYVGDPSAKVQRPARELKGFQKVRLAPGQRTTVKFHLDERAFAYYDVNAKGWRVDPGKFVVYIGNSVDETPLQHTIQIDP